MDVVRGCIYHSPQERESVLLTKSLDSRFRGNDAPMCPIHTST